MENNKLKLPVNLMCGMLWLLGLYGGYVILGIAAGFLLIAAESGMIRKTGLKVLVTMLAFSLLSTLISLVPNLLDILYSAADLFNQNFNVEFVYDVTNLLSNIVYILRLVVFIGMGVFSFLGKELRFPIVDNLLENSFF